MGRKTYLIIIYTVTGLCMVLGIYLHVIRPIYHVGFGIFETLFDAGEPDSSFSNEQELNAFENLDIDVDVSNITIERGSTYSASYSCQNIESPTFRVDDNTLIVTQKKKSFRWGAVTNQWCDITITVPSDAIINTANIESDVGDISLSDLTIQTSSLSSDVGNIEAINCELGDADIESDVGDVDLERCTFANLEVDADIGEIDISTTQSLDDYTLKFTSGIGEIMVNGEKEGTKYNSGNGTNHITLNGDIGSIKFATIQ